MKEGLDVIPPSVIFFPKTNQFARSQFNLNMAPFVSFSINPHISPKLLQYQIYKAFKHIKQQRVISKSVSSTGITLNGAQVGFSASKVLRWINKVILDSNDDVARAVALKYVVISCYRTSYIEALIRRVISSWPVLDLSCAIPFVITNSRLTLYFDGLRIVECLVDIGSDSIEIQQAYVFSAVAVPYFNSEN